MSEDSRIKILASHKLQQYVIENCQDEEDAPENIKAFFFPDEHVRKRGHSSLTTTVEKIIASPPTLTLQDLSWLRSHMQGVSKKNNTSSHLSLHELLENCSVLLPKPPVIERNPELEARIQRLKKEQEEREYKAMTKNVDNVRVHHPDDSLSSQMKMLNSHLIAVFQFVISVGAGFTFGFIGIELMVGSLDFGFRLLLGIACALIIALAEIYFLAKKLSEEYEEVPIFQKPITKASSTVVPSSGKLHKE